MLAALSIALVACGPRRAQRDAGADGRARDAAPRTAVDRDDASPAVGVGSELVAGLGEEPTALALVVDSAGDVAVVADEVGLRRVHRRGRPPESFPRSESDRMLFASAIGGVITSVAVDGAALVATTLDGTGRSAHVDGASTIESMRRASNDRVIYVARAARGVPVVVDAFELTPDRLVHRSYAVDRAGDDLAREVVGIAADESGFAMVYRRSTPEDDRGGVVLATERGTHPVDALHDLGMLESIVRRRGEVVLVGSFEFDRPIAFLFDARGRLRRTERLAPGASASFAEASDRANLELDGAAVLVRVRDRTGDLVRDRRFARADGRTAPVIARDRHGFSVAWTDRSESGWCIRLAHVETGGTR